MMNPCLNKLLQHDPDNKQMTRLEYRQWELMESISTALFSATWLLYHEHILWAILAGDFSNRFIYAGKECEVHPHDILLLKFLSLQTNMWISHFADIPIISLEEWINNIYDKTKVLSHCNLREIT